MNFKVSKQKREVILKPKVEPNYRRERRGVFFVVSLIMAIIAFTISLIISIILEGGGESIGAIAAVLAGLLSLISEVPGLSKGNYEMAVKAVNALNVEEWAYNSGIAIMRLAEGYYLALDTTTSRVLVIKDFMARDHMPISPKPFRHMRLFSVKGKQIPQAIRIEVKGIKRLKVIRGEFVLPSLKSSNGRLWGFGLIVKAKLGKKCTENIGECLRGLVSSL